MKWSCIRWKLSIFRRLDYLSQLVEGADDWLEELLPTRQERRSLMKRSSFDIKDRYQTSEVSCQLSKLAE